MSAAIGIVRGSGTGPELLERAFRHCAGLQEIVTSPPLSIAEVSRETKLLVLTLPPAEALPALALIAAATPGTTVVSTDHTLSLQAMRAAAGPGPALLRAIMITGGGPGEGIVALAPEPGTAAEIVEDVRASLAWVGMIEMLPEEALDAVAALAFGSAGFVCAALAGLEDGAQSAGLPAEVARPLVYQTALATGILLRDRYGAPADLKDQVASPGGTTIVALAVLEDAGVRGTFIRAVQRSAVAVRMKRDARRPGMIE